jgi:phosphatidate cytidylyltransferase
VLKQRVLTAVILAAVLLGVLLWSPPPATVALFAVIILAGAWEWAGFIRGDSLALRLGYTALIAALLAATYVYALDGSGLTAVLSVAMLWWFVALVWVIAAPGHAPPWLAAVAGVLSLVPAWAALVYLCTRAPRGPEWALFALALTWAADTGAFFAGRLFGRTPLAPRVSPKKTWEGVAGGLVLSAVAAWVGARVFGVDALGVFVLLCVAVAALSIVGDLTESLLKRAAGLKDSGWLFPGHGGVLDRIDSVTAAAPSFLLGLLLLEIVA